VADENLPLRVTEMPGWERNPRTMDDLGRQRLAHSLWVFGDLSGVVFNRRTGHLVCGHQRRDCLRSFSPSEVEWGEEYEVELGEEGARFVSREREGWFTVEGGARFRVRLVDWDEPFEAAANVAANNPYLQGDWDWPKLDRVLADLSATTNVNLADLGFAELDADLRGALTGPVLTTELPESLTVDSDEPPKVPFAFGKVRGEVSEALYERFRELMERLKTERGWALFEERLEWLVQQGEEALDGEAAPGGEEGDAEPAA